MNCLIMIAGVCALDPGNVYLTAGLSAHDNSRYDQAICANEQGWWHRCSGPYGELKIGTVIDINDNVSIDLGWMHRSFISEPNDVGTNGWFTSVTYRPWRR